MHVTVTDRDSASGVPVPYDPPPPARAAECVHARRVETLERAGIDLESRVRALAARVDTLTALVVPSSPAARGWLWRAVVTLGGWLYGH